MLYKTALLTGFTVALTACGGGGSSPDIVNGIQLPSGPPEFRQNFVDALALAREVDGAFLGGTTQPTPSAPVQYNGFMTVTASLDDPSVAPVGFYQGTSTATFDPAGASLSGSGNNFYASTLSITSNGTQVVSQGQAVSGTVTYSGAGFSVFDEIAVTVGGNVDGKAVAGTATSGFYGTSGELLETVADNVTVDGTAGGLNVVAKQ